MGGRKLYIIGNGFDRHHNLETSYAHFHKYVREKDKELYEFFERYFDLETNDDGLWADFEAGLGRFEHGLFFGDHDNTEPMDEKFKPIEWAGVGDELKEESEIMIEKSRNAFYGWLTEVENSDEEYVALPLDHDSTYLSFNYTDTLNMLYSIPRSNILHIHNAIKINGSDLIFGHGIKVEYGLLFDENGDGNYPPYYAEAEGASKMLLADFYKDTEKIIETYSDFFECLADVEKIIVLGHSLNDIDLPYFVHINKIARNAKWAVSYYNDDEPNKMHTALSKIGVTNGVYFFRNYTEISSL